MRTGAPGEELAPLVGSGLFGGLPAGQIAAADQVAFPAYLDGLDVVSWADHPARVRSALLRRGRAAPFTSR